MQVGTMEILGRGRSDEPVLGLDRPMRESLAIYVARRWSANRRKEVERAWGLTPDEARGVIQGTASVSTLDKVWKAGGWSVVLPVMGAVIGHGVGEFFAQEAERVRREAEQAREQADALAQAERIAFRSFDPGVARRADPVGLGLAALQARDDASPLGGRKAGR